MENSSRAPSNSIAAEIGRFETFGAALREFFQRFDKATLFEQHPPRESREAAASLLAEGRYLLRPSEYQLRNRACGKAVSGLLDLLGKYLLDREDAITLLKDVFAAGELKAVDFLSSIFRNKGHDIVWAIRKFGLEEDLTTFFAVYLARPFRSRAARFLTDGLSLDDWLHGYCPVSGHWPALAHIDDREGHRTLWCMHCGTTWPFKRIQCAYCLNEEQDRLELISTDSEPSYRAHLCSECRRYLKEVRSTEAVDKFDFDTVYLGTHVLDLMARSEGYIQESPLTVRYDNPDGSELLTYRRAKTT